MVLVFLSVFDSSELGLGSQITNLSDCSAFNFRVAEWATVAIAGLRNVKLAVT